MSSGLRALNAIAAPIPPRKLAIRNTHMLEISINPIIIIPTATAGLNAPPDTLPTAYAPTSTVKPMAKPKYEFPAVF